MVAQNTLRTHDVKIGIFRPKKIGFDHSFDVTKCFDQIEIPEPSNIKNHGFAYTAGMQSSVRQTVFVLSPQICYV